jgi:5'(3')-deoxyribonucleotidase
MKILYIDMDGVVADFDKYVQPFIPNVELGDGDPSTYEERSKKVDEVIDSIPDLFERLELYDGALEAIETLKPYFEIYFLSSPVHRVPESYAGKRRWIKKHFGEWADKRLILTHRKDLNIGDYLVDDRKKNGSESFSGEHIHFRQDEFPDWKSVVNYLLKVK